MRGMDGAVGATGMKGMDGAVGATGMKGEKGDVGPQGPAGRDLAACKNEPAPGTCAELCACDTSDLSDVLFVENFNQNTAGMSDTEIIADGLDFAALTYGEQCLKPMIFDTSCPLGGMCSGQDCHLGTPNGKFGGPGCGKGGKWGTTINDRPLGKCLMVSEDNDANDPDDNQLSHSTLKVGFCAPVKLRYVIVIDPADGSYMVLFDENGENGDRIKLPSNGPNSVITHYFTSFDTVGLVSKLHIDLTSGGCLAEVGYTVPNLDVICDQQHAGVPRTTSYVGHALHSHIERILPEDNELRKKTVSQSDIRAKRKAAHLRLPTLFHWAIGVSFFVCVVSCVVCALLVFRSRTGPKIYVKSQTDRPQPAVPHIKSF